MGTYKLNPFDLEDIPKNVATDISDLLDSLLSRQGGEILKIGAFASPALAVIIALKVAHLYAAIAVWDHKLGGYVVAISDHPNFKIGDVIT
jgi:CRISPR-associated protein Csx3